MDAPEEQSIQSILAVDCGALHTRALLMDVVAEEYRFVGSGVAPTTAEAPYSDLTVGVYNAIMDLEATTGRRLVDGGRVVTPQHTDGHGVDVFVATCSAAPAIRLVVAGVTQDFSARAARQAASSAYTHLLATISVDEPAPGARPDALTGKATRRPTWTEMQVEKLLALSPDVALLTGGVDGGPVAPLLRLADVLARAAEAQRQRQQRAELRGAHAAAPPLLFFAGNAQALEPVQAALGDSAQIVALPNIQPALGVVQADPVRNALMGLMRQRQMPSLPGYEALRTWTRREIEPTVSAVELVTRYISMEYHREALTADIGAASVAITVAGGAAGERRGAVVRGDFGLAQGITALLAEVGPEAIRRWLPFEAAADEVQNWALNRALRPWTVPQTARDLAIEHAFAREALRSALVELRAGRDLPAAGYDLLIGTGGLLANAPRVGQAAMILLDGLEPTGEGVGSLEVALDSTLLMPALGALAPVHPGAAAYLFDRDCLVLLGTCVVPLGGPPSAGAPAPDAAGKGPVAVEVTVEYAEAGSITIEVPYGSIEVIPLRPEQRASLRVKPSGGFRVGSDEPGKQVQTRPGEEIKGGLIGLIIDARGRPLVLPEDDPTRIAKLLEWGQALRAYAPHENFDLLPQPERPAAAPLEPSYPAAPPPAEPVREAPPLSEAPPAAPAPAWAGQVRRLPGTGPLRLPSMGDEEPAPPDPEPNGSATPASGGLRRVGATGRLNLPSVDEGAPPRRGTAPLRWPKGEED